MVLRPTDAREPALVATLHAGGYSAIVSGKGNSSGVGLFELYDLDAATGRVANISTRSRVETGDNVMIGGFILTGTTSIMSSFVPSGLPPGRDGVSDALLDPTLELYDSNGALLARMITGGVTQEAEIIATTVRADG